MLWTPNCTLVELKSRKECVMEGGLRFLQIVP